MTSSPIHAIKEAIVLGYAKRYGLETFVETGTFQGDMIQAMLPHFKQLYSIELDGQLYIRARQHFESYPQVHLFNGYSTFWLRSLCAEWKTPALFWLDAHYSGEGTASGSEATPILEELDIINKRDFRDVILIDDAHLFGADGWPTLEDIQRAVQFDTTKTMLIEDDIIRLEPK